MDQLRFYAGIVTFNPQIERLKENIEAIGSQLDTVLIIDNGSENVDRINKLSKEYKASRVVVQRNAKNIGIAAALNAICAWGKESGYDYVLTLDQDSVVPTKMICILSQCLDESVGIACPAILDINRSDFVSNNIIQDIDVCITSGALTSIRAWQDIGGFDESMFIDGVDFDFCIRLKKMGWRIVQNTSVEMKHEIGKICERKFFCWKVVVRNHSAFRKYYIARNIIFLDKKHRLPGYPWKTILRVVKLCLITALYEQQKAQKLKAIWKGVIAGVRA